MIKEIKPDKIIERVENIFKDKDEKSETQKGLYLRSKRVGESFRMSGEAGAKGIPIMGRKPDSDKDPNIKTASDFINLISMKKAGYLSNNIVRNFNEEMNASIKEKLLDKYKQFDRLNHIETLRSELMYSDSNYGQTFTVYYIDKDNLYIKEFYPWNCYIEYDKHTNKPLYGITIETVDKDNLKVKKKCKRAYIYTDTERYLYEIGINSNGSSAKHGWQQKERLNHGFKEVPIVEWLNNKQVLGNAERVVSYVDAYDTILSDGATEQSSIRSAILFLQNLNLDMSNDEKKETIQKATFIEGQENSDAKFVEKNVNPENLKALLDETSKNIYRFSYILDTSKLTETNIERNKQLNTIYQDVNDDAEMTIQQWKKSLQREDAILRSYFTNGKLTKNPVPDYEIYDIDYVFNKKVPLDILADLEIERRAGVERPNYNKLQLLGEDEKTARALSEEANAEILGAEPIIEE